MLDVRKILFCIFIVTFMAIIYVNQQTLIYQMGLQLKENQDMHAKLVDHNKIMVYNVLNLRSPANLDTRLSATKVELGMPRKWQVVKVEKGFFANLVLTGRR